MAIATCCGSLDALQEPLIKLLHDIRDLRVGEMPRSLDLKAAPIINQWSYGLVPVRCLAGSVRGHPILGNMARIHTSELILVDPDRGWARTWSRYYRLGTPEGPATGLGSS